MALLATHIRFALEVKDRYKVLNVKRYISGTLYPDSRYKTGVERVLTHPDNFRSWDVMEVDDFKKGWFVHLLCDQIQTEVINDEFPDLFFGEEIEWSNSAWVSITAIKELQDLEDVKNIDIKSLLPEPGSIEARSGEKEEVLMEFYKIINNTYSDPGILSLKSYYDQSLQLGFGKELASSVVKRAEEFKNNDYIIKLVPDIYPEIIRRFNLYAEQDR
jgi:hypothetical protein